MLIQFSLSALKPSFKIKSATVVMHHIPLKESAFFYRDDERYERNSKLSLYAMTKEWQETDMNEAVSLWPDFESSYLTDPCASYSFTKETTRAEFDITTTVEKMLSGEIENQGLVLITDYRYNYAEGTGGSMSYWHSAQAVEQSVRPVLQVEYEGEEVDLFELTVENGTGSGFYTSGDQVTITAKDSTDYTFTHWSGDIQYVDNPASAITYVRLPDCSVSLKAEYKKSDSVSIVSEEAIFTESDGLFCYAGKVCYFSEKVDVAKVSLYTLQGRLLKRKNIALQAGITVIPQLMKSDNCHLLVVESAGRREQIKITGTN